jgi:DNA-binding MarR family transcriptional regulator
VKPLVTRRRDAKDARVSRVFLTPRGKKLREPVQRIWAVVRAEAFAGMSGDELDALLRLASTMRDNLLRSLGEAPPGARKK